MRTPKLRSWSFLLALLALAWAAVPAGAARQSGMRMDREAMWPAPTEEDWAKPCLIVWQRTYEDALAVSRETGSPILVCVNMDGEIASEHYAGVRYRQPEIAELYEPYVTVIASVYRHNPRDHDDEGRRILCPRFGSVTCGEHIAIEPGLFDQFFEGQRVAPRHIGVELARDGMNDIHEEIYDVYYAFDTDTIFDTLREGVAGRESVPSSFNWGDRPLIERVGSHDVRDRSALEHAYLKGDRDVRSSLLSAARASTEVAQVELLRLAVFDADFELRRTAWQALAERAPESAIDLMVEALKNPLAAEEHELLVSALEQLGATRPRARTIATVHRGLATASEALDADGWSETLAGAAPPAAWSEVAVREARLEERAARSEASPGDAAAQLELAEALLALAVDPRTEAGSGGWKYAKVLLEDARAAGLLAEELGASGWRVNAVLSLAAGYLDDVDEAYARAEAAVAELPDDAQGWTAMTVLAVFAEARAKQIDAAIQAQEPWPAAWMADADAAYAVLLDHPFATDAQVVAHYDLLRALGAYARAGDVLALGLERFPASWELHRRLRERLLREKGAAGLGGLEDVYAGMLQAPREAQSAAPALAWFAGYASLVSAEFHRRRNQPAEALASYDRAVAYYEEAVEADPAMAETSDHYVALALAGRARLAYERGDTELALQEILASFARRSEAAASLDGLGLSPVATAWTLVARLRREDKEEQAAQLETALEELGPELLRLPAFERTGPRWQGSGGRRGR